VQHSESQANHLQVLAAGGRGDVPGLGAHIVDDRLLEPGNEEVSAFVDDALANTAQTVEDDGAVAAFDIVERGLGETDAGGEWDGEAVDGVEGVCGHCEVWMCVLVFFVLLASSLRSSSSRCPSMMLPFSWWYYHLRAGQRQDTERSRLRTSIEQERHHHTTDQSCLSHSPVISSPISHIPTHTSQNASLSDPHGWWWKARLVSAPWTRAHTPRMREGTPIERRHERSTNTLVATSDPGVPSVSNNHSPRYHDMRSTRRHHDQPN